jgi:type II secretory pathway component PulK
MEFDTLKKNKEGFIALITVLIISAVVLLIGLGVGLASINEANMSLQENQSSQAYYLANLCSEWALMKLKETGSAYRGEIINIENGTCQISVESKWIVKVSANFSNQTKKMKIVVSKVHPEMIINSWQEVANF